MEILGVYFPDDTPLTEIVAEMNSRGIYDIGFVMTNYADRKTEINNSAQDLIDQCYSKEQTAEELVAEICN